MIDLTTRAQEAVAFQEASIEALKGVPISLLETMRTLAADDTEKRMIDLVLLMAKRDAKAEFEASDRWSDAFDKAALPIGAAVPAAFTLLNSQHMLPASLDTNTVWMVVYVAAALIWLGFRGASTWMGRKARTGMAQSVN